MVETQLSPREPLFVRQTLAWRRAEEVWFKSRAVSKVREVPLSELEAQIADFHFRRPVPLPLAGLHGWHIRPFWRDMKETPPLPIVDKAGRVYKLKAPPPLLLRDPLRVY